MFDGSFTREYYDNTVIEWLTAIGIGVGAIIAAKLLYWLIARVVKTTAQRTKTQLDDLLIDMLEEPVIFALVIFGFWYGLGRLTLPHHVHDAIDKGYYVLIIFNVAWFATRMIDALIEQYIVPLVKKSESDLDDQLLPIVRKGIKLGIWVISIIMGLDNAGFDVVSILAGLGIGGLALALAAQDTVSNLFGGISIFLDKPFKVGDRIMVTGYDGEVTDIGIRSTRIETRYEGRIVTLPNRLVASSDVVNVDSEQGRQMFSVYRLSPDLEVEQIELALALLKAIARDSEHTKELVVSAFLGLSEYSNDVSLLYWIKSESSNLKTRTQINLEILRQFRSSGITLTETQRVHAKHGTALWES
jgi:MscS family membrane protein